MCEFFDENTHFLPLDRVGGEIRPQMYIAGSI